VPVAVAVAVTVGDAVAVSAGGGVAVAVGTVVFVGVAVDVAWLVAVAVAATLVGVEVGCWVLPSSSPPQPIRTKTSSTAARTAGGRMCMKSPRFVTVASDFERIGYHAVVLAASNFRTRGRAKRKEKHENPKARKPEKEPSSSGFVFSGFRRFGLSYFRAFVLSCFRVFAIPSPGSRQRLR
jgi:hypothetical protein